jgi:flagellin
MSITRILTNPDSIAVQANLNSIQDQLSKVVSHLSTGLRITTGADDPSGVTLANKFRTQQSGTEQAVANVQDGLSLLATADSALNDTQDMLRRMRDLAVKASNDAVLTTSDQANLDTEFQALMTEINRRAQGVSFNTKNLLDGTFSTGLFIQVGANNASQYQMSIVIYCMSLGTLSLTLVTNNITTLSNAISSITVVQSALNTVSSIQAGLGVAELKLNHVINDLQAQDVNIAAAKSRITDADMASEISAFTKLQVLTQVGTAMLSQANAQPQMVLSLLGLK